MKVWNIKYCLTGGITHVSVEHAEGSDYVYTIPKGQLEYRVQLKVGRDAFKDHTAAFAAADAMRKRKIASLKKKIAQLEKMDFGPVRKT